MSVPCPRPEIAVGIIVIDEVGRVLLIQRGQPPSQGRWSIPGGRVERGETLLAACQRELYSETGISARIGPLIEVAEHIDARFHYVILDYLATDPQGKLQAGEDALAARFVALDALSAYDLTDGLEPLLQRVLKK